MAKARTRNVVCSVGATLITLVSWGCAASEEILGLEVTDAGPPPSFVQDESKGDAAAPPATTFMCVSSTCGAPYTTCPNSEYLCSTNLDTDMDNCGRCGNVCPRVDAKDPNKWLQQELNTKGWACLNGQCQMLCSDPKNYLDCNGYVEDGCETKLGSDDNCLGCGDKCPPGFTCDAQTGCYDPSCHLPRVMCGNDCVNLDNDDRHCGQCNYACRIAEPLPPDAPPAPPHMSYRCSSRQCNQLVCDQYYANCNGKYDDGCEVHLQTDNDNCGACGVKCGAGQFCSGGKCYCKDPCDCIDNFESDPENCGACGNRCPGGNHDWATEAHGRRTCRGGRCGFACEQGYADCNHDLFDACEVNLQNDPQNCGACGHACLPGQACANGACATEPCSGPGAVQ